MKISDNRPPRRVAPSGSAARAAPAAKAGAEAAPVGRVPDTVAVLGIPESDLSPAIRRALQTLLDEVQRLRYELEHSRKRIEHLEKLADEDTLVPIINRRAFVRELMRMMSFAERYGSTGAIIYFDLNDLKTINDTLGHAAGDAAIRHVAEVLMENVRGSDIVGRLGGDEFGVALAQTDQARAMEKGVTLAAAVAAAPLQWEGKNIALSLSWGVHTFAGGDHPDNALAEADRAMYRHKKQVKTKEA